MDRKKGVTDIAAQARRVLADDPLASEEIRLGRAAFLKEVERRNLPPRIRRANGLRRVWLPLGFAASVAVGAAGLWLWQRADTFQIGEARDGKLGDLIEAVGGATVPVSFSEGSTLMVHDGGRIRVLSLEAGATRVLVEDGIVDASIAHRRTGRTKWEFDAGDYRVTVNGTRFRMDYRSATRALRVSTEEGQVTVTGGGLKTPRVVAAGDTLAPAEAPTVEGAREPIADAPVADSGVPLADSGRVEDSGVLEDSGARLDPAPSAKPGRGMQWQELIAAGRLREGLRAAERSDFELACETASIKELLALADAGRFFGPSKRAVAALSALRRRFPGSPDAGTAAFTLGRIAAEKEGAYARAAHWFEVYLREAPNGPLMGDAFGRLMEARLRSGDIAGARSSAQQYLRRFPAGPYAAEARDILSQ